jgi:uncharacterized protein
MMQVAQLYRYPVKGLSAEPTPVLALTRDHGVLHDRTYALALGTTQFSPEAPQPLDKGKFLMLRANEILAALSTHLDPVTSILTILQKGRESSQFDLSTAIGRAQAETFFTNYAGADARGQIKLVHARGHKFTDISVVSPAMMRAISVINLETVRLLQARVGHEVHPLRFRANVYIDGLDAAEELDWEGREICIGPVRFRGALRTRRCAAIDVNPMTAGRDSHLPKAIMRHFGHPDLGIYLEIMEDGILTLNDRVFLPNDEGSDG